MGVFGFVFWGCIQEPLLNFHGQLCLPWELLGWSSPQCWLYPYPFWDILPLAIGHPGFAGWEQEYFIPTDYGMVVVTAAFEEHPNVAREVWTPHPWKYSRPGWIRLGTTRPRERCPCPWQRVGTEGASKRFWNSVIPCLQHYGAAGKGRLEFQRWLCMDCSAEKFL